MGIWCIYIIHKLFIFCQFSLLGTIMFQWFLFLGILSHNLKYFKTTFLVHFCKLHFWWIFQMFGSFDIFRIFYIFQIVYIFGFSVFVSYIFQSFFEVSVFFLGFLFFQVFNDFRGDKKCDISWYVSRKKCTRPEKSEIVKTLQTNILTYVQ